MWLSVDPMADKYPEISPYVYCNNNPVRYIDPDGMEFKDPPQGMEPPVREKNSGKGSSTGPGPGTTGSNSPGGGYRMASENGRGSSGRQGESSGTIDMTNFPILGSAYRSVKQSVGKIEKAVTSIIQVLRGANDAVSGTEKIRKTLPESNSSQNSPTVNPLGYSYGNKEAEGTYTGRGVIKYTGRDASGTYGSGDVYKDSKDSSEKVDNLKKREKQIDTIIKYYE